MGQDSADVIVIGVGAAGGILAKELGSAGLKVIALERGELLTPQDYAVRDAIKFISRENQQVWSRYEPVTFRATANEAARVRYPTVNAVGGALLQWTGQSVRFAPRDFKVHTNEIASGVAERAKADLSGYDICDWPIGYDDLEPYYERYEWEFGISGGGLENPFAGPRNRGFPLPPLRTNTKSKLFEKAARALGYHPYTSASGITSQAYRPAAPYDERIAARPGCVYCGHCNNYGCHVHAKASTAQITVPVALQTGNVDVRTGCKAATISSDGAGRVTGVRYFSREGDLCEAQARAVIVCGYTFENSRLLLASEWRGRPGLANTHGRVGRGIFGHGDVRAVGIHDDAIVNSFVGPNSAAVRIDDFNGNNFDHADLGFIRGASIGSSGDGTPVERFDSLPPGVKRWGAAYKEYLARTYTRSWDLNIITETLPHTDNIIDLDPDIRDRWGLPVPRVTFQFKQNERRLQAFIQPIGAEIMRKAGATTVWTRGPRGANRWAGGTRMGSDPRRSVVNGWCQAHEVENLFVVGSSTFPTITGYPGTATVAALAYRTADYIKRQQHWF